MTRSLSPGRPPRLPSGTVTVGTSARLPVQSCQCQCHWQWASRWHGLRYNPHCAASVGSQCAYHDPPGPGAAQFHWHREFCRLNPSRLARSSGWAAVSAFRRACTQQIDRRKPRNIAAVGLSLEGHFLSANDLTHKSHFRETPGIEGFGFRNSLRNGSIGRTGGRRRRQPAAGAAQRDSRRAGVGRSNRTRTELISQPAGQRGEYSPLSSGIGRGTDFDRLVATRPGSLARTCRSTHGSALRSADRWAIRIADRVWYFPYRSTPVLGPQGKETALPHHPRMPSKLPGECVSVSMRAPVKVCVCA